VDPKAKNAHSRYDNLIKKYIHIRDKILFDKLIAFSTSPISLFGPESFEAIDVIENLPKEGKLFRLFGPLKTNGMSEAAFYYFTLTQDNLTLHGPTSLDVLLNDISKKNPGPTYLIHDRPDKIIKEGAITDNIDGFALSAAHFIRSNMNQKPFKKSVLAIPGFPESIVGYDLTIYSGFKDFPLTDIPKGIHTLLLSGRTVVSYSVPTRPGEIPAMSFVMESARGDRVDMLEMLSHLSHLSLALLPNQTIKNAYPLGHLFSIYGCPTIVLPSQPTADNRFILEFLKVYQNNSAANALSQIRSQTNSVPFWLIIGHGGLSPEAAKHYAQKYFKSYVQKATQAYENNQPAEALVLFESAIEIATDSQPFKPYLAALYQYARESAHQAGNYHRALYYANTLADMMAIEQPDTAAHGESLLRLGLVYARLEQFEPSVHHLNEALEIFTSLKLDPQKIETLSDIGVILEKATEYDRAIGFFQTAVSIGKVLDQKGLLARQYTSIGRINDLRLSRYALAIENYQKALKLYREMPSSIQNSGNIAQALLNIGRSYRLIGNFIKADRFYLNALKTIEAHPSEHRMRAKIVIEQANNAWYQARYTEAFKLQRISFGIATENRLPLIQVISLNTAGLLWWSLGNYEKALFELNQAISIARMKGIRKAEIATTLNNMGLIYREMGQYSKALNAFDSALAIDQKLKSRWGTAYDLRHKGITFFKMQKPEKAIPLLKTALNEAHAIGNLINESKTLLNLGDVYFSIQNRKEAKVAYQKALTLSQNMSIHEIKWRSLYGLANLSLPDQPRVAERLLRQAIEVIESIRSNIKIAQLKENFLFNKLMVYETLCRLLADAGKISEAFEIAERSRARNFIDLLGNQRLSLNRNIDQKLYDQQATLKERIEMQSALVAQSTQNRELENYQKALFKLKNDLDNVMLEIQHQNPQLLSLVSVKPLDVKELMKIIGPETALIYYYILSDEILSWVVKKEKIELFRTPIERTSLGEKILDFRRRIQNLEPLDTLSNNLYNTLIAPIISSLKGVKQIGIVPHGYLHYLSFATLWNGTDYFIDNFPLFYIPSAGVLKYTLEKRGNKKNSKVLAVGNPDLGDPVFDLPFAEHEVDSIKWNFSNITTLTQERATKKWVVEHINEYGIIHLASHGEFDPINPLFSSIKLAKDRKVDGDLAASEIFGLKINADLVVLSACQTGLGKVTQGDDVIGLTRAFLYAGTHTLISTLWRVSDISTAILIKNFYRRYTQLNKADSLRQAMLHVKNRYPHPGYWGAFTLVGDFI
jgi:CHAT domain-containing protein/Tfp pilus assembly protein PilF